jgi:hypothetical protein
LEYEKDEAVENDIYPKGHLSMYETPVGSELQIKPF